MNKSWGNMASVLAVAVLLALFSLGPLPGQATTYWNVTGGDFGKDWHDAGNWTAGVPNSTTDAVIDNGGEANTHDSYAEALNLTVGDEYRGGVYPSWGNIHVKGNLILEN